MYDGGKRLRIGKYTSEPGHSHQESLRVVNQ